LYPYDITRNGVRAVSHSNGNDGNQNRDLRDLRKYWEIKPRNRRDREERVVQKRWNGSDGIATVMGQLRKKRHHEKRTEHPRTIVNVAKFRCVRACSKNRTNFFCGITGCHPTPTSQTSIMLTDINTRWRCRSFGCNRVAAYYQPNGQWTCTEHRIDSFETFECSICHETCETVGDSFVTGCKHRFHSVCFAKWQDHMKRQRNENVTCPLCRGEITCIRIKTVVSTSPPPVAS
jgi:hypothetical protein